MSPLPRCPPGTRGVTTLGDSPNELTMVEVTAPSGIRWPRF